MEGRPNEALSRLDESIATADHAHSGLPKTLRLQVHVAMDRSDLAAAEFDAHTLAAAEHWPDLGYPYWFSARSCSNALFTTEAGDLLAKSRVVLEGPVPAP